jgi:uncharacterized protein (TIGR02996 family)
MNHKGAFPEDVLARPEDPAVKLIFADWLDENGRPDLAHACWMARPLAFPQSRGHRALSLRRAARSRMLGG